MFRPHQDLPLPPVESAHRAHPWEGAGELGALAFATLWTTGPDPDRDGAFRLAALRRDPEEGGWEAFERVCDFDPILAHHG